MSAFCDPETTTSIPQASVSSGTAPSDEIASTTSRASPTASLTRADVGDHAGRRVGLLAEHEVDPRFAHGCADLVGVRHLAPLVPERLDVEAVLLANRDPALAERSVADDRHAVAGRAEVRDRRLHRPGPGRGEEQDVGARAADLLQALERARVDVAEVGPAVMDDRLGTRREHGRRHGRRPRREEVALFQERQPSAAHGVSRPDRRGVDRRGVDRRGVRPRPCLATTCLRLERTTSARRRTPGQTPDVSWRARTGVRPRSCLDGAWLVGRSRGWRAA